MEAKHNDCMYFSHIDVAKGMCKITKQIIPLDGESSKACENIKLVPKCENCRHFSNPDKYGFGSCTGFDTENWTYGHLKTINCENHEFK